MTSQLIATVTLFLALAGWSTSSDSERRLINYLLYRNVSNSGPYNPLIRPVKNRTDVIKVNFGTALYRLINVNERAQVITANMWLRVSWFDYQLQWDPIQFENITKLSVDADRIWLPDLVMFNNADGNYEVSFRSRVVLGHTGDLNWIPPSIYKTSCQINVRYFPFDQQECELKFGSWTFNGNELELDWYSGPFIDLNDYEFSGTWDIVNCPAEIREEQTSPSMPKQTIAIFTLKLSSKDGQHTLVMRRKTLFYIVNLIMPCTLTSFLSVAVFYLPAIACEKITLSISILIGLVVFQILLQKSLPPSNELPLLANYLLFTFVLNIISIVLTIIIINWSFRSTHTHYMPRWIRILLLGYLPKVLFIKRPEHNRWREAFTKKDEDSVKSGTATGEHKSSNWPSGTSMDDPSQHLIGQTEYSLEAMLEDEHTPQCHKVKYPQNLKARVGWKMDAFGNCRPRRSKQAIKSVDFIVDYIKFNDNIDESAEDWVYVGQVLDRLSLYIFVIVTVIGTCKIILNNPFAILHALAPGILLFDREDWMYAGMVVDRLLLWIFFIITTLGTLQILMDNPYMMEIIDQRAVQDRISHLLSEYAKAQLR